MDTKIDIIIRNVERQSWQHFQGYCRFEGVTATSKIKELIAKYVKEQGKE
jgi:hypothetical protein